MRVPRKILAAAFALFSAGPVLQARHSLWPEKPVEMFKENYVVTGVPLNTKPAYDTNDLTFQVSLRYNVVCLPKDWNIFFGYTQMTVWDVYRPSNPFRSNTYNPGLYFSHDFRLFDGNLMTGYEHRSNGYDSDKSRSLDYVFASLTGDFFDCVALQLTGRFGIGSMGNSFSLEMFDRYQGYLNAAICLHTPDRRLQATASVTPLFKGDIKANISAEISYCPIADADWFHLTLRYHHGYNENQNDCGTPDVFLKHMLRAGVSIQPRKMAHKLFF